MEPVIEEAMTERAVDVVHIGSACRDLTGNDPRGWRLGGGATYSALTTARLGLRTGAIVGVDATAASAVELDLLREAGVDLVSVPLAEGPIFVNRETPAGRVQTCVATGQPLPVGGIPGGWRSAPAWSLVPVAAELDAGWLSAVPEPSLVSLGWQGLLRQLRAGAEVERLAPKSSPLLGRADLVGVSRHDLAPDADPSALLALLRGGSRLVMTDGAGGGRVFEHDASGDVAVSHYEAVAPDLNVDPTGAGDVFLAALLAAIVQETTGMTGRSLGDQLRFAATAASFVVEAPGLNGVPALPAVLARLARAPASRERAG